MAHLDSSVSAVSLLSLLEEPEPQLKEHALKQLYAMVDRQWPDIASSVPLIEELSEDSSFAYRELAAAVASRCFFHLEEYNDALRLALGAGAFFDVSASSSSRSPAENQFVDTMVSKCIDKYVELRDENGDAATIDPRMTSIVERMFERCYSDGAWTHAMGVALEARRLDQVREGFNRAPLAQGAKAGLLTYTLDLCVGKQHLLHSRDFRLQVLGIMVEVHQSMSDEERDYAAELHCFQQLDNAPAAAQTLMALLKGAGSKALLAYQLGFDIAESDHQPFILALLEHLSPTTPKTPAPDDTEATPAAATESPLETSVDPVYEERLGRLVRVLQASGFMVDLQLNFLHGQSKADALLLVDVKDSLGPRTSQNYMTLHQATVAAHGFMFAGTANTGFVRENMEWFKKSNLWAKFSAMASIGVIHRPKGLLEQSKAELDLYLPKASGSTSPYSEGGALYALGLIHAAKAGGAAQGSEEGVVPYLVETMDAMGPVEPIQQGACLAIGLAAMGTADTALFEKLREILFNDDAIAGEGAAYGIGLLLLGRARADDWTAEAMTTLLSHIHETKHEKIIRALSMSLALTSYAREEEAETLIETLSRDRDAIIRYGAMYTIGLAYVGTSNNSAVKRLLHVAVSDVSDDVRRAAVTNLGFVLYRQPERLPALVALLTESYNPHVRYGSALALGIALAGHATSEAGATALELLETMHGDAVDFVQQGSLMATAMILMQQPESHPAIKPFREQIARIIKPGARGKNQPLMTRVGAITALGLLDAGGRNVTLSLGSRNGFTKASAVVGVALWAQHWYWFPLQHMLGLSFSPTAVIGLNAKFEMPKSFSVVCGAKPSQFAYPKMTEIKKEEKKERVATVSLSTTARAKAREVQAKKEKVPSDKADDTKMDETIDDTAGKASGETKEGDTEVLEKAPKKKGPEPSSFSLSNPSRVTPEQEQFVAFDMQQRYVPVNPRSKPAGIVILVDRTPDEAEDVVQVELPQSDTQKDEAKPPEPFEWSPDMQGA